MARFLYNLLLHAALPLIFVRLWWRSRHEAGYQHAWAQRFGQYGKDKKSGLAHAAAGGGAGARREQATPLIWLHAVSLGESHAAQPLVAALAQHYPTHRLLVTHMTATGREAAQKLYGGKAQLAWLPYDFPWAVERFYAHFEPCLGILMETEVWPNLARAARLRGMPMLLANARMSEKSLAGYQRIGHLSREAFGSLIVGAQTEADATRLKALGATRLSVTGNLKFDIVPITGSAAAAGAKAAPAAAPLRGLFGAGRVFLAASTRDGEEELLLDALARAPIDAVTVIVPRHPQRFEAVAGLLKERGIEFTRRSHNVPLPAGYRVVLGDSLGEMAAYYAACDCAFVGGSLLPLGGQNLIEACAAGTPVLVGLHTFNFAEVAGQAVAAGAALRVADADALMREAAALLGDAARRQRMGEMGRMLCAAHRGATVRTMQLIKSVLPGALETGGA